MTKTERLVLGANGLTYYLPIPVVLADQLDLHDGDRVRLESVSWKMINKGNKSCVCTLKRNPVCRS